MRVHTAEYELKQPGSLGTALEVLAAEPNVWRPIAGGTDLMVPPPPHLPEHTQFLDLNRLRELRGMEETDDTLTFGALTTFTDLRRSPAIHRRFPCLIKSAVATAALAIQNRGTVGGNIMNGSPAADTPPSLLAYDAEVELRSLRGARWVALDRFWTGYKQFDRAPDELLTRIRVHAPPGRSLHYFRKVGARAAQAISKATLAGVFGLDQGRIISCRIGAGALAPCCKRAGTVEALLRGQPLTALPVEAAAEALLADIAPIDDIRSTAAYRRQVACNMLLEMLDMLAAQGG
jgi:CO/xanthine dehydrogenase FAD-binding subunit